MDHFQFRLSWHCFFGEKFILHIYGAVLLGMNTTKHRSSCVKCSRYRNSASCKFRTDNFLVENRRHDMWKNEKNGCVKLKHRKHRMKRCVENGVKSDCVPCEKMNDEKWLRSIPGPCKKKKWFHGPCKRTTSLKHDDQSRVWKRQSSICSTVRDDRRLPIPFHLLKVEIEWEQHHRFSFFRYSQAE